MTSRRMQAEIDRQRAQMRHEVFQQRQSAAAEVIREEQDRRDEAAAKVLQLRKLRLAREAGLPLPKPDAD